MYKLAKSVFIENELVIVISSIKTWSYSKLFWFLLWMCLNTKGIYFFCTKFKPTMTGWESIPVFIYGISVGIFGCYIVVFLFFVVSSIVKFINLLINE